MQKLSYDATWADLVSMARANAGVLAILAGAFLLLPNFAQALFAPPPDIKGIDMNAVKALYQYYSESALVLLLCNIPVWFGSAALLALLLDPRHLTVAEALVSGLQLLFSVIALNFLTQFAIFGAPLTVMSGAQAVGLPQLVAIVLFGFGCVLSIYLIGRFALAAPAQMAERLFNPIVAMRRSIAVTRGNGWRIVGILALVALVVTVAGGAVMLILSIVLKLILPPSLSSVALALLKSAVGAVSALLIILLDAALFRQLTPKP